MPIKKLHQFTVEGSGTFPYDMLRYDRCWPSTEAHDSGLPYTPPHGGSLDKKRITLTGLGEPTQGRWESFGWRVVETGHTFPV